jgi:hypothetical protein
VAVRVHEAGQDQAVRGVDPFGVPRLQVRADGGDPAFLDENVGSKGFLLWRV